MKKIILLILFITQITYSQNKGLIQYGFIDGLTDESQKGLDYNAYMIFNNNQSYYVTAKDSLEKIEKIYSQKINTSNDYSGGTIYTGMKSSRLGDQVVYHIQKKTMWSNYFYKKHVYIKEPTPIINWKITKDTKKIGSLNCKKATAFFRGRNYIAWYTTEIMAPFGPWKLNGLPGLIIEAYDTNKNVYWYFKNIEYPSKSKQNVKYLSVPKGSTFIDYDGFKKFQKEQIIIASDKLKMVQKEFPEIILVDPKISEMFIEIE